LQHVNIKYAQISIQACKTWTKKSRKWRVEWTKASLVTSLWPWKLSRLVRTRFASKVAMFQQTFEFKVVIHVCYSQQTLDLQGKIQTQKNLGHYKNHCFNLGLDYIKLCVESMLWLLVTKWCTSKCK
jgi:hypothetical protein